MHYPQGSLWGKWDLQVHTPASAFQQYGGNNDQTWDRFLADLESLPPTFKVIGITDYIFLDGYNRVRKEKDSGRLANIDLILPAIELRLDSFGGSDSALSRANFHIIFSDQFNPDIIQQQFINALRRTYSLTPAYERDAIRWDAIPTLESLKDLGERIIAAAPPEKRKDYGPPLVEGFNSLNFKLDDILRVLQSHYFAGNFVTAVGKTEWCDIRWNQQSVADKRTIINNAHFVFVASETVEHCLEAKRSLSSSQVNDRLLDCSDAHRFSSSEDKDRIGRCCAWIKADPCFEGLLQAFHEPEERIYLGQLPTKVALVEANKTKYISTVAIAKKPESNLSEIWFADTRVDLNNDLVAVIGHKGSGKSALTDIIGLVCNTRNASKFTFLSPNRFNRPNISKGDHFVGAIVWANDSADMKPLSDTADTNSPEKVKYIPQGLFEDICNELALGEETNFDRELKKVIFSRVDAADRLEKDTLDALIDYRTHEIADSIAILESELSHVNERIVELEEKITPDYSKRLENAISLKRSELVTHDTTKPIPVPKPEQVQGHLSATMKALEDAKAKLGDLQGQIRQTDQARIADSKRIAAAQKSFGLITNFQEQFRVFKVALSDQLALLGIAFDEVAKLEIETKLIKREHDEAVASSNQKAFLLDAGNPEGLIAQANHTSASLNALQKKLDEPNRRYAQYEEELRAWSGKRAEIIGGPNIPDSLTFYLRLLREAEKAPQDLEAVKLERLAITRRIYAKVQELQAVYRSLYGPVQEFVSTHRTASDQFRLTFDVSITSSQFSERFFDWIGRNVVGSFYGQAAGEEVLQRILNRHDFNYVDGVISFLDEIIDNLTHDRRDKRSPESPEVSIASQLKRGQSLQSLYDYLFSLSYLRPRYVLKLGGKDLSLLSPGERGAVLLIFYLLIDKDDIPLVIDQPDENLDNQTVYELLVTCIKEAKRRRQIIIVTHNPNLAVVCDAEQIVCCSIDKVNGNRIEYVSGAIENPDIKKKIIDILEGTPPAFANRGAKYRLLST